MLREKLRMLGSTKFTAIQIVVVIFYIKDQITDPDPWFITLVMFAVALEFFNGLRRVYAYDRGEEESFAQFLKRFSKEIAQGAQYSARRFLRIFRIFCESIRRYRKLRWDSRKLKLIEGRPR